MTICLFLLLAARVSPYEYVAYHLYVSYDCIYLFFLNETPLSSNPFCFFYLEFAGCLGFSL